MCGAEDLTGPTSRAAAARTASRQTTACRVLHRARAAGPGRLPSGGAGARELLFIKAATVRVKALALPQDSATNRGENQEEIIRGQRELGAMLPAANVTARQRGRGSGGALRLAAVVLLVALLALCLARADAAASLSPAGRAPSSEKVVESASLENARGQEVERGHYTTLPAAATAEEEEDDDDGPAVPERVELEVIEDYTPSGPNNRHQPHP